MLRLNTQLSDSEKKVLEQYAGDEFEVLTSIDGESYILSEFGELSYNDCFEHTENEYFAKQQYEKVIPYRILRFYHYYLMNMENEKNVWYRGHQNKNGNWEYECYFDSLEEVFDCL